METLPAVLLTIAAVWGLSRWAQITAADKLNFLILGVQLNNFSLQPNLTVQIRIQNPTTQSYSVQSFTGNVTVNDLFAGNLSSFTPVTVPANGQVDVQVTVLLNLLTVVNQLVSLFSGTVSPILVTIAGTADVENIAIPFTIKYQVA